MAQCSPFGSQTISGWNRDVETRQLQKTVTDDTRLTLGSSAPLLGMGFDLRNDARERVHSQHYVPFPAREPVSVSWTLCLVQ